MGSFITTYASGGRLDMPFYATLTHPYTKGFMEDVPPSDTPVEITYGVTEEMELLGVGMACSSYNDGDNWSLLLNGVALQEHIFTKNHTQGMHFIAVTPCKSGDEIKFRYDNASKKAKKLWVNLQFLKNS